MKKPSKRMYILATVVVCLCVALGGAVVRWRVRRAIRGAEQSLALQQNLRFVSRPYQPSVDSGFEWVSAPAAFTSAAEFQGHLFVAGPVGVSEYDERGRPIREFRVGRDLPSSPVVRLALATVADSRQPELLIATSDAGLLFFNGSSFRQLLAEDHDARSVTTVLPTASGTLLIGTSKRGVLAYDGHQLRPFHSTLDGLHVTELYGTDSDLWIGTADKGVAHWHGGTVDWFNDANGLSDPHVYSIAQGGDRTFVGTSTGIAEFENGKFARTLAAGAFVRSLMPQDKSLLAGTMDDGILDVPLAQNTRNAVEQRSVGNVNEVEEIFRSGDALYALTPGAVYIRRGSGTWSQVLAPAAAMLADRNVSSLALDRTGRLWIGYFDRGLDIVDPSGKAARHIEDDHVFCINRILAAAGNNGTAVATANGLVLFDAQGNRKQILSKADGLIADHVTDVAMFGNDLVAATPAGLTFLGPNGIRSMYAFHGLVNNHVYTLAPNGRTLLAGTLGGISLLENEQVRASLTTATSRLKANWTTAAVSTDSGWWIGTYGAGIFRVDMSGHVEPGDGAGGNLVINPNAMISTDRFILAGSMGHGLYLMDRNTNHWSAITEGLPSLNVTALTSGNGYIYVGTDNGLVRIPEQRLGR